MKNKALILLLALSLFGVGCSKPSDDTATTPVTDTPLAVPDAPTTGTPSSGTVSNSNTVTFYPVSLAEMNTYVATHPLNAPSNFQLTVDMTNDGQNRFYGRVEIAYTDNGTNYRGVFQSGSGTNSYLYQSNSNGMLEYYYNYWFNVAGKVLFNGFFQDAYGAVVLVIDSLGLNYNQGDGQGGTQVLSGSVWYRNFSYSQEVQGAYRKCWYITLGPYQCGSGIVQNKSGLEPTDTYRKLGTFSGLPKNKAFH